MKVVFFFLSHWLENVHCGDYTLLLVSYTAYVTCLEPVSKSSWFRKSVHDFELHPPTLKLQMSWNLAATMVNGAVTYLLLVFGLFPTGKRDMCFLYFTGVITFCIFNPRFC